MRGSVIIGLVAALLASPVYAQGECGCPGDISGDRIVDFADVLQILENWGCMDCPGSDANDDGVVDFADVLVVIGDWGCGYPAGLSSITGTVVNAWTGDPIVGATVDVGPCPLITNEFGQYEGEFPIGEYLVKFGAMNFIGEEQEIILFPDLPATLNAALTPVAPVVVTIITESGAPGDPVIATAVVDVLDGSTVQGFVWTQTEGAPADLDGADAPSITLELATSTEYRAHLMDVLIEPPIDEEDLPENVELPEDFPGGLQNRIQVVGASPFALEEAGLVGLQVDVTTTSGVYIGHGDLHTVLPWRPSPGIRDVPIGIPVLIRGRDQEQPGWAWDFQAPDGSNAVLLDSTFQNAEFTPDVPGLYRASVLDMDAGETVDLFIFAGTWRGIIAGQDDDGRPVPEAACLNCHVEGGVAADKFTPWIQTGHAEIFTNNLNTSPYWGPQCFQCHTVGYDLAADNFGVDDADDYLGFLMGGLLGNPDPDNWTTTLAMYPVTAQKANIQCENCHGPQNGEPGIFTAAHSAVLPRVSLSSDVCATCHGEPLRHARFQQWQLSGHANYEVAIDESESGNCSRCHTANGFLTWLPILLGDVPGDPMGSIEVTWTPDEAHPQTCVTCHDPHAVGTESGEPNNATVRISGNTPELIAGFTAYAVGRGAICMTCHNSRRGLRNDSTFDTFYGTPEAARAPHGSSQTDVLMGENAYLVETGDRGNHSFVTDTCTNCHMVATPPPPVLSYNGSGTNHTFFASKNICTECHFGGFEAEFIQGSVQDLLDMLQFEIEESLIDYMAEQIDLGNMIDLAGQMTITDVGVIADLEFGEFRGRQSMTITFTDETVLGPFRMNDVDILDELMDPIGEFYDFADPNLIKAGWNWNLVNNDGSIGVHNPSYAIDVLAAGLEGLDSGLLATVRWPEWYTRTQPAPSAALK